MKPAADPRAVRRPGIRTKIYVREDMIGSGKVDLLRAVAAEGSLAAAARAMGMGEKRMRFLLRTMSRCFDAPLIETSPRGARVTPLGHELIRRYDAHIAAVEAASAPFLDWLEQQQAGGPAEAAGDAPRRRAGG